MKLKKAMFVCAVIAAVGYVTYLIGKEEGYLCNGIPVPNPGKVDHFPEKEDVPAEAAKDDENAIFEEEQ